MISKWNAEDYAKHSKGQHDWALGNIARLALRGDERVLDLGCGEGKITVDLAARVPAGEVVGVDRSPEMIELATRTWGSRYPNVTFMVSDAQALDFIGPFDLVFSNSALHWVPDHPAVLAGLARNVPAGGRLFLSMGGRGTAALVFHALDELAQNQPWAEFLSGAPVPYFFFGPDEYRHWLPESGFTADRVELVSKPMPHADRAALQGWLRTVWTPYTDRLPVSMRTEFLEELTSRVQSGCVPAVDGTPMLPMVNLEVEARKTKDGLC